MGNQWLVGVDIGGTTIKLAFITLEGNIVEKWEIPTNKMEQGNQIPIDIAKSISEKFGKRRNENIELAGIGVGAPGPVDGKNGVVIVGVNLGWDNFPLKSLLEKETSLPVIVDNDANMAALGEMWKGSGEGSKDLICVTIGTGVGGGVIANGEILHGVNGAAGEIGHITVTLEEATPCNCGKSGCLETVASATGVVRLAKSILQSSDTPTVLRDTNDLTSKFIFDSAKAGDLLALHVVEKFTSYLGFALASTANVINPEKIVIGGGVSKAGDTLLRPLKEQFQRFAFPRVAEGAELTIATLGNDAGVIGAAYLAMKHR